MKRKTARHCERHFRHRLAQRYGIATGDRFEEFCAQVRGGSAQFVDRESLTRTHWLLQIDGQAVRAVYDKQRGALVTALPRLTDNEKERGTETLVGEFCSGER